MSYSTKRTPKKFSTTTNKQSLTHKSIKNTKGENTGQRSVEKPANSDQYHSIARRRIMAQKTKSDEVRKFRDMVREVYHQSDRLSSFVQTSVLSAPLEVTSDRYLLGQYKFPKDQSKVESLETSSQHSSEIGQDQEFDQEQLMMQIRTQIQNRYQKQQELENAKKNQKKQKKAQSQKIDNKKKNPTQNEEEPKDKDKIIIDGSKYLREPIANTVVNQLEEEEDEESKNHLQDQDKQFDDFNEDSNSQTNENNEVQRKSEEEDNAEEELENELKNGEQLANEKNEEIQLIEPDNETKKETEPQKPSSNFNDEALEVMKEATEEIEAELEIEADILEEEETQYENETHKSLDNGANETPENVYLEEEEEEEYHQDEPENETQEEAINFNRDEFLTPEKFSYEIRERNLNQELETPENNMKEPSSEGNIPEKNSTELENQVKNEKEAQKILPNSNHHNEEQEQRLDDAEESVQEDNITNHYENKVFKINDPSSPTNRLNDDQKFENYQNRQNKDHIESINIPNQNLFKRQLNFSDIDNYNPNTRPLVSPRSYKSPFSPQTKLLDQFQFAPLDPDDPSLKHSGEMLLEISVRPFLYNLSIKYGQPIKRLREIPEYEFKDWKSMGFQWIWLYGVWTLGENCLNFDLTDPYLLERYNEVLPGWQKDDVIGYPLSIVSYQVNPEIGDIEDLIWFRNKLKESKIKLMLDFVPNHTAIDAPEVTEHPEYYIHASHSDIAEGIDDKKFIINKGNIAFGAGKFMPPMRFTAQLNIFNEKAKEMQISNLISISKLCDGVRVHLAQYLITEQFNTFWKKELAQSGFKVPETEFWKDAIDRIRSNHPDFIMMAETYGIENQMKLIECGFSYIYEKELIDHLVSNDVAGFRNLIFKNHFITDKMVHFIENHDEKRMVTRFFGNRKAAMTASAALLTLPGIRLINMQQWLGYTKQIDVNLRRAEIEKCDIEIVKFYNRLFSVLDSNALRYGTWEPLKVNDDNDKIIAWKWVKNGQHILVTINFNNCWSQGKVICEDANTDNRTIYVREMISETYYTRDPYEMRKNGLVLSMEPYQAQIFEY